MRALLAGGLVDHLHLPVYPLTRGEGIRLFPDGAAPARFALADSRVVSNQVLYLDLAPQA